MNVRSAGWLGVWLVSAACVGCGGDDDAGGDDGGGPTTGSEPITSTCSMAVTGDAESGLGSYMYESSGYSTTDIYNNAAAVSQGVAANANVSIFCDHRETEGRATRVYFDLGVGGGPLEPLTISNASTDYELFNAGYTSPEGTFKCFGAPGFGYGTFEFTISSVEASYRHDSRSVVFYDIRASGHAECPEANGAAGTAVIDISF